jgi:hypothetical protein
MSAKKRKVKYKKFALPLPVADTKPKLHPVNWARHTVSAGVTKDFLYKLVSKSEFATKKDKEWVESLSKDYSISSKKTNVTRKINGKKTKIPSLYLDNIGCRAVRLLTQLATQEDHGLKFTGHQWVKAA